MAETEDDYDDRELEDLKSSLELLRGKSEIDAKRLPAQKYLAANSSDDLQARRALARLLRSQKPLDGLLRTLLAGLIDPDPRTIASGLVYADRQIRFVQRSRRSREDLRRLKIGLEVLDSARKSHKIEAAIVEVAEKYQISESAVQKAWGKIKDERWAAVIKTPN